MEGVVFVFCFVSTVFPSFDFVGLSFLYVSKRVV